MLTTTDLHDALDDERHNGWGYACSRWIERDAQRNLLDRNVVAVANELGLSREGLFQWADSKYGRHLCDDVNGRAPTRARVRVYLNAAAIATLARELSDCQFFATPSSF